MTEAQRPSIEVVTRMIGSLLEGRRFKDLTINKVEYVHFPSAYNLNITWESRTMTLKVPAELVDDALASNDLFKRRKIKRMIKDAFGVNQDDND